MIDFLRQRRTAWVLVALTLTTVGGMYGWRIVVGGNKQQSATAQEHAPAPSAGSGSHAAQGTKGVSTGIQDWHPKKEKAKNGTRSPKLFRGNPAQAASAVAAGTVSSIVGNSGGSARERVDKLQKLRGQEFAAEDRERAMGFLADAVWPDMISKQDAHWLADELLTALRMQ